MKKLWQRIRRLWNGTYIDPKQVADAVAETRAKNLEAEANRGRQFPGGF